MSDFDSWLATRHQLKDTIRTKVRSLMRQGHRTFSMDLLRQAGINMSLQESLSLDGFLRDCVYEEDLRLEGRAPTE